jgi:ArsR family metal-binding transcriptional regulator
MKIIYRKPTLIEQMTEAIAAATKPIEALELTQSEFQSVYNYLDKTNNKNTVSYSYKGIAIKVADE